MEIDIFDTNHNHNHLLLHGPYYFAMLTTLVMLDHACVAHVEGFKVKVLEKAQEGNHFNATTTIQGQ